MKGALALPKFSQTFSIYDWVEKSQKDCIPDSNISSCSAELTRGLISVFDGEAAAIVMHSFMIDANCARMVANLTRLGLAAYRHVNHRVAKLGLAQMEHRLLGSKATYFESVEAARIGYSQSIDGAQDPIAKLKDCLAEAGFVVRTALEESYGEYFAGTYRNVMDIGHLHFDYAPFETPGWNIDQIDAQLSWNLYLNSPVGGELIVYDRVYSPEHESFRVTGEYYYRGSLVKGRRAFRYQPRAGDLVIFNSRHFHEVQPVTGSRYTLSSFIGRLSESEIILWS